MFDGVFGVYFVCYVGIVYDDVKNNEKLFKNLEGVELDKRMVCFYCIFVVVIFFEKIFFYIGEVEGVIVE